MTFRIYVLFAVLALAALTCAPLFEGYRNPLMEIYLANWSLC